MIRTIPVSDGFSIQRFVAGSWQTFQEVSTLEQADFVMSRLREDIHYTSQRIGQRRARPGQAGRGGGG